MPHKHNGDRYCLVVCRSWRIPRVKTVLTDLGYRGMDADITLAQLVHRGKRKTLSNTQRRWLKRRQAIEPIIGHVRHDHGMRRCWLKGQMGDAVHAVLCAAGYNLRWLLRAIARLGQRRTCMSSSA